MYKVLSVVDNLADIVSTDGNIDELPTKYEIGSCCSYTDPNDGELYSYKLTSADGTLENKQWVEMGEIGSVTVNLSGYAKTVDVNESLSNKVDKIDGKGLSTNDFTDEYKAKVDEIENIPNCYYIENLGIKCDGTDETAKLRSILNTRDNATYIFPSNKTIIVTEPIIVEKNNLILKGNGTLIKVKDNCNILKRHSDREFINYHEIGILDFRGDWIHISHLDIDVNCQNNYCVDSNGGKWYIITKFSGSVPEGFRDSGIGGIRTHGNNNIIEYCHITNGSWNGINVNGKTNKMCYNNIIRYNIVERCMRDAITMSDNNNSKIYGNKVYNNNFHSIHVYVRNFNIDVFDNNIYYTQDFTELFTANPNFNEELLPEAICLNHSNYTQYETQKINCYDNNIYNYSPMVGRTGILLQYGTFSRDIMINNNHIYNFYTGIRSDIYHYGKIVIQNNTISEAKGRAILITTGIRPDVDDGLPTFTTEIPNCEFYIIENKFYNCNDSLKYEDTQNEHNEDFLDSCKLYDYKNYNIDKRTINDTIDVTAKPKIEYHAGVLKKSVVLTCGNWTIPEDKKESNFFEVDYGRNIQHVYFDVSGGTSRELFYIRGNFLSQAIYFPCTVYDGTQWKSTVVSVEPNGKVILKEGASGITRVVGSFEYPLAHV